MGAFGLIVVINLLNRCIMFERSIDLLVPTRSSSEESGNEDRNEVELKINQEFEGDVGCVVWDAALVLVKFLESIIGQISTQSISNHLTDPKGIEDTSIGKLKLISFLVKKRVTVALENDVEESKNVLKVLGVGAGTGVCSIALAALIPCSVSCTDLKQFKYLIDQNIARNRSILKKLSVAKSFELDWSKIDESDLRQDRFDLILISDCIYYDESIEPLVEALKHFCSNDSLIIMSFEDRESKKKLVEQFWKLMDEDFAWHEISVSEQNEEFQCDEIHIFVIYKTKTPTG